MKRDELIRHLQEHGCVLLREGANHSIYQNPKNKNQTSVGRHRELADLLCRKVCRQLGIPETYVIAVYCGVLLPMTVYEMT